MSQFPQPYDGIITFLAVLETIIQILNVIYAINRFFRGAHTIFTFGLAGEQVLMLGFALVNIARTRYLSADVRTHQILSIFADICFNASGFVHILLLVFRFRLVNTGWYRPIWDKLMVWGTVIFFTFTAIPALALEIHRLGMEWEKDKPLPYTNVIGILFSVVTLYALLFDTVLCTLMYRHLKTVKEKACAQKTSQTTTNPLHKRTVCAMIGLVSLCWVALIIYIIATVVLPDIPEPSSLLSQLAYTVTSLYMTFSCVFLLSIKMLLDEYGHKVSKSDHANAACGGSHSTSNFESGILSKKDTRVLELPNGDPHGA